MLHGVCDRVRGDGDAHMRGIGCLLTGIELYPGNIQGGSDTPAGWAKGHSVDQEIRNFLQQLQSAGALACHDQVIVIGRNHHETFALRDLASESITIIFLAIEDANVSAV